MKAAKFLSLITLFALSACTTSRQAPIVDRSSVMGHPQSTGGRGIILDSSTINEINPDLLLEEAINSDFHARSENDGFTVLPSNETLAPPARDEPWSIPPAPTNFSNPTHAQIEIDPLSKIPAPAPEPQKVIKSGEPLRALSPVRGKILTKFREMHDGETDDGVFYQSDDNSVKCTADGSVVYVDESDSAFKTVVVRHGEGLVSTYTFSGKSKCLPNKIVKAGEEIGDFDPGQKKVLYFTVKRRGKLIDPESIITDRG